MKTVKQSLLSIVIATGLASTGVYAAEQKPQAPTAPAMPEQAAPAINVSDEQVGDFVAAYVAVQTLNQEYATKLQATSDNPEKSQQLQKEAQSDMQAAITETGLSLDEYKKIALAANDNEQLRQRISSAINESTTAPSDS
ncbi:DUF4168 domain-containing protein [Gilvimarinus polysaccharolyticus]|uniref:DUF4168 domain-containing protein n=1 Tax=Gilvimarinus polysaccharolyticus TaxID=863921 RepID=UPI0006738EE6|nr:DUF4168 domain-containing protein [Gilvimarinus polysaccharolyticus]